MRIKGNLSLLICFILALTLSACKSSGNQLNSAPQSSFESNVSSESSVSSSVSDINGESSVVNSSDNALNSAETALNNSEAVTTNEENNSTASIADTPNTENVSTSSTPHNHNYILKKTNAATCTANGYNLYKCECGQEKKETINKKGHSWGGWITVTAPTATAEGKQTRTCAVCKTAESKSIAKLAMGAQDIKNAVFRIVNEERVKNGLSQLTYRSDVQKAADIRAKEIAQQTLMSISHTRPNGTDCFTVFAETGVKYMAAGENIAAGQRTPEEVMTSWLNSPGHRANILNEKFTGIAVGVENVNGTYYWVQLFVG